MDSPAAHLGSGQDRSIDRRATPLRSQKASRSDAGGAAIGSLRPLPPARRVSSPQNDGYIGAAVRGSHPLRRDRDLCCLAPVHRVYLQHDRPHARQPLYGGRQCHRPLFALVRRQLGAHDVNGRQRQVLGDRGCNVVCSVADVFDPGPADCDQQLYHRRGRRLLLFLPGP